jgi:hypothetical protein
MSYERLEYFGYIYEEAGLLENTQHSPGANRKLRPKVAFGERVIKHDEVSKIEGVLKQQYKLSPSKIRKAGIEELVQIQTFENQKNRSLDSRQITTKVTSQGQRRLYRPSADNTSQNDNTALNYMTPLKN